MKHLLASILALFTIGANAASVNIADPAGVYADVTVAIDGGTVRYNSQAVDQSIRPSILSGNCVLDYTVVPGRAATYHGWTCAGPGVVYFRTTGSISYTCPSDGGILEATHLTLTLDGEVFYDKALATSTVQCWTTPATPAAVTWQMPYVVFDNTAQARLSATTTIRVQDAAWNFTEHTFTMPNGVACSPNLVNVGTRFKRQLKQIGFVCEAAAPAGAVLIVNVN